MIYDDVFTLLIQKKIRCKSTFKAEVYFYKDESITIYSSAIAILLRVRQSRCFQLNKLEYPINVLIHPKKKPLYLNYS